MADKSPEEWAREEAVRLRTLATSPEANTVRISAVTSTAMQFLADHAAGTTFEGMASAALRHYNSPATPLNGIALQLEAWADYRDSGMATYKPFEVRFRIEASTDIMEQAQQLLQETKVHVAAPVVLAGASLEEFLRSMVVDAGLTVAGKPSINAYALALQAANLIDRGATKDVTAWADARNEAAHGNFGNLSRERTALIIEGINLFINRHS